MAPPHRSCQWSLAPLEGRKSNDSTVNLWKSKGFGPPLSMSATDLAPSTENTILTWKRPMTKKKGHQKFWEIDEHFLGEMQKFFDKRLKKRRSKILAKIWPPCL